MSRPVLLLAVLLALAACGAPRPVTGSRRMTDSQYLRSRDLMVPVAGVRRHHLRNSYTAARSGGRAHLALDIMAKKGSRVLAVDDGFVLRITMNDLGGRVLYLSDPDRRFVYYYAHLDKWASGLQVGQRVRRGQLLGWVGTTGNAPKEAPHLHFQLLRMASGRQWWSGEPINPIPYLRRAGAER